MRRAVLVLLLAACRAPDGRTAEWERHATALSGHWSVSFSYAKGGEVTGGMDLTANRTVESEYARIGIPADYGTYAVTFRDLGGAPSGTRVPAVVAGFVGEDSVLVLFDSDRPTFHMEMRGRLENDSVRGTWIAAQSRGTIASGSFMMVRP
jgi:hypothetical protein